MVYKSHLRSLYCWLWVPVVIFSSCTSHEPISDSSAIEVAKESSDVGQGELERSTKPQEQVLADSSPDSAMPAGHDSFGLSEEYHVVLDGDLPESPFASMCQNKSEQVDSVQMTIDNILQPGESCEEAVDRLSTTDVLDLGGIGISDLSPPRGFVNITYLNLSNNQISNLEAIASMTRLQTLDLSYNQVDSLKMLQGLSQLRVLDAEYNAIMTVEGLGQLNQLEELDLHNNQIVDISELASLTQLTHLELAENQITDIVPLGGLKNLLRLDLDSNKLSDCSPIAKLSQLIFLDISHNPLQSLEPLKGLQRLESLYSLSYLG
ncbi:MAG: leucine-rich repeat domain-containing protein [Oligoflexales bacterium]|nr:leucine-rich repeat domain-containing protein [Oligoflexales bacterium]